MSIKSAIKRYIQEDLNFLLLLPAMIALAGLLLLPFVVTLSKAFYSVQSFQSLVTLLADRQHLIILARSSGLAFAVSLICTLVAYPLVYALTFYARRFKDTAILLMALPLWLNILVQVYAWYFVLDQNGLINAVLLKLSIITTPLHLMNTPGAVFVAMVQTYLPFVAMPLFTAFEKFDYRMVEASSDLGATPRQTFFRVILPMTLSGARVGFFLVLVMSFGEFAIPTLMGGGKHLYVGTLISNYFLISHDFATGAAFTLIALLALAVVALLSYILFRLLRRGIRW